MRGGNVYHCWTFDIDPNTTYDVMANHYNGQAMFENASIYTTGACYVQFHNTSSDPIPIYEDEESLTMNNFRFRKLFITNTSASDIIHVRVVVYSKNEVGR